MKNIKFYFLIFSIFMLSETEIYSTDHLRNSDEEFLYKEYNQDKVDKNKQKVKKSFIKKHYKKFIVGSLGLSALALIGYQAHKFYKENYSADAQIRNFNGTYGDLENLCKNLNINIKCIDYSKKSVNGELDLLGHDMIFIEDYYISEVLNSKISGKSDLSDLVIDTRISTKPCKIIKRGLDYLIINQSTYNIINKKAELLSGMLNDQNIKQYFNKAKKVEFSQDVDKLETILPITADTGADFKYKLDGKSLGQGSYLVGGTYLGFYFQNQNKIIISDSISIRFIQNKLENNNRLN